MKIVDELVEVFKILRDPEKGCPWDKKQTFDSMAPYIIEEAWEVVNAINKRKNMCEELGDLLLNIMFLCQIASEEKLFNFEKVCETLHKKLIAKHPHVFGGRKLSEEEVLQEWERKRDELEVSHELPSTIRARTASERAARLGIQFQSEEEVWEKIKEELCEVAAEKETEKIQEELGDLLFCIVELCRFKRVDPEIALNKATDKFLNRVSQVLKSDVDATPEEKWNRAKLNL